MLVSLQLECESHYVLLFQQSMWIITCHLYSLIHNYAVISSCPVSVQCQSVIHNYVVYIVRCPQDHLCINPNLWSLQSLQFIHIVLPLAWFIKQEMRKRRYRDNRTRQSKHRRGGVCRANVSGTVIPTSPRIYDSSFPIS